MPNLDKEICVLNYNINKVYALNEIFDASQDGETPCETYITFRSALEIAKKTTAFSSGVLEFNEDEKESLHRDLRIRLEEPCFTCNVIKDMILNYTYENASKIVKLTNRNTIDRFKIIMATLTEQEKFISPKMIDLINRKDDELSKGKYISDIVVERTVVSNPSDTINTEQINNLEKQNKDLQEKLESQDLLMKQMQEMMSQLLSMQQMNTKTVTSTTENSNNKVNKSNEVKENKEEKVAKKTTAKSTK